MRNLNIFLVFLFLSLLLVPSQVEGVSGSVHVEGPVVAATETNITYRVYLDEYFEKYKCTMLIAGENLTGANPLNEVIKSSDNGKFEFEITTPKVPQTLYISFRVLGYRGDKITILERELSVEIVNPLPIKVKIRNTNDYDVSNILINFYVDGEYIGNITVDKLKANNTESVVYKWIPQNIEKGKHTLKIVVASEGIVFENDKTTYSYQFYYGKTPSYDFVYYLGWGTLIVVSTIFSMMVLGRRSRKTAPPPKWKK